MTCPCDLGHPEACEWCRCQHPDVRYFPSEKRAIACMVCGRLFGRLDEQERLIPYNPPVLAGKGRW